MAPKSGAAKQFGNEDAVPNARITVLPTPEIGASEKSKSYLPVAATPFLQRLAAVMA